MKGLLTCTAAALLLGLTLALALCAGLASAALVERV